MPDGGAATLWEDDDMRAFYENFPELKALIPSILYSDSEKPTTTPVRIQVICIDFDSLNFFSGGLILRKKCESFHLLFFDSLHHKLCSMTESLLSVKTQAVQHALKKQNFIYI